MSQIEDVQNSSDIRSNEYNDGEDSNEPHSKRFCPDYDYDSNSNAEAPLLNKNDSNSNNMPWENPPPTFNNFNQRGRGGRKGSRWSNRR